MVKTFIDEEKLKNLLKEGKNPSVTEIESILEKGKALKGLSLEETAKLIAIDKPELKEKLFQSASYIKNAIYGDRLVFFAPLYLSNFCINDCHYCGFHARNDGPRKKLTLPEVKEQVSHLIHMGHKRLLLEFGEDPQNNPIDYIVDTIRQVYSVKGERGEIRRANINVAATTVENYKLIRECGIGTYQLFQETYHRKTYHSLHPKGPKSDYLRQLYAMDRAFEAGIDDVGLGVLFGLYDWPFEVLALLAHTGYLQDKFGVGPHTISIPRFRPAASVTMEAPCPVSDDDFLKLIAILRIAVPYTGMIITTREKPEIREMAFRIGITQTSAASKTSPGAFGKGNGKDVEQFKLSDVRSLDEIAVSIMEQGYTPSFCTACYRKNRTGETFMDLAKPGDIQQFCGPNSILTLMEYLEDHASPESKKLGIKMISKELGEIKNRTTRKMTEERIERIRGGERDIYF
ncbi:MAG: [FeFe] hydrogenase H-cluster radical SAM maturase HydG [Deltaproteobacteria bacterium]|nr:[FeFe] hydrogenase H-cluster radical SAM maturase HydG [Deltaproteobacteria bacterium]